VPRHLNQKSTLDSSINNFDGHVLVQQYQILYKKCLEFWAVDGAAHELLVPSILFIEERERPKTRANCSES
jgi:hypothetical protein